MKINFEKPIKWQWICLPLTVVCLLLTIWIISDSLYDWRDFRYENTQEQLTKTVQVADNLAISLSQVGKVNGMPLFIQKNINVVLQTNGFSKYQIVIAEPDTTKGK